MRMVPGFILREIAGNTVAIPTGEAARHLSGLAAFNGTGKFLFSLLQSEQSEESLTEALLSDYEVSRETAAADVAQFLSVLRENHMLIEDGEALALSETT